MILMIEKHKMIVQKKILFKTISTREYLSTSYDQISYENAD